MLQRESILLIPQIRKHPLPYDEEQQEIFNDAFKNSMTTSDFVGLFRLYTCLGGFEIHLETVMWLTFSSIATLLKLFSNVYNNRPSFQVVHR